MKMKALVLTAVVGRLFAQGALSVGDSSAGPDGALRDPWGNRYRIYLPGKEPLVRTSSVSPDGGLRDPWGNPYRIHLPGKEPLIRSAAPSKQLDDSGRKKLSDKDPMN